MGGGPWFSCPIDGSVYEYGRPTYYYNIIGGGSWMPLNLLFQTLWVAALGFALAVITNRIRSRR